VSLEITVAGEDGHMHRLYALQVPRPVGTDTSAVLVSVFSRLLRHSESSAVGGAGRWRMERGASEEGSQSGMNDGFDAPVLQHRYSESCLADEATKKGFWTSTSGHPPGGPIAPGKHRDAFLGAEPMLHEVADKLSHSKNNAGKSTATDFCDFNDCLHRELHDGYYSLKSSCSEMNKRESARRCAYETWCAENL
jgi:hypothetical protein